MRGAKHTFHLSMSSVSQGLSTLCVEGIFAVVWDKWYEAKGRSLEYFVAANSRKTPKHFHRARPWRVKNAGKSHSPPKHQSRRVLAASTKSSRHWTGASQLKQECLIKILHRSLYGINVFAYNRTTPCSCIFCGIPFPAPYNHFCAFSSTITIELFESCIGLFKGQTAS